MDLLEELRRRLDVDEVTIPDDILQWCLTISAAMIDEWNPTGNRWLIQEATIELAVKIYDLGGRGTVSMDPAGEWVAPAPTATAGLINSVMGILGPALPTGGAIIA